MAPQAPRTSLPSPRLALQVQDTPPARAWHCYLLGAALVCSVLGLRQALDADLAQRPLMTLFVLPIIVAALLGGLGPGLATTTLAALAAKLFAVAPLYTLRFSDQRDLLQWLILLGCGAVLSVLSGRLRGALLKGEMDRALLVSVAGSASDAIFVKDTQGRYLLVNEAAAQVLGLAPEHMLGRDDASLLGQASGLRLMENDRRIMAEGRIQTRDQPLRRHDGSDVLYESTKGPVYDGAGQLMGVFGISRDVTGRRKAEAHLAHLALHDALTGLPNRLQLDQHWRALAAQGGDRGLTLLVLNLDRFKDVNDSLGHDSGDALLVALAGRLRQALRAGDLVARVAGDEFVFLLQGVAQDGQAELARRVLAQVAQPCRVGAHELMLSASLGLARWPEHAADLPGLIRCADVAMARAKRNGRNGYCLYTPDLLAPAARRMQLVAALSKALELEQLSVHYQPQYDAGDGRLTGAEALLRWQHPELGPVAPAEFIPAAEDSGLIIPIGEWVLRQAVRQMRAWLSQGCAPFVMAVNLSAVQFRHPDLPQMVATILEEEQLPPQYLELELTESGAMADVPSAVAVLDRLHERGVRMAIDDFGVAYSSLSYLKKFRVDKLKIDQCFVRDLQTDPEDRAIVAAIINVAKGLGLRTLAEGVETAGQRDFLRAQGCDQMQGYLYSRPLPPEQFSQLMAERALQPGLV